MWTAIRRNLGLIRGTRLLPSPAKISLLAFDLLLPTEQFVPIYT